MKETRVSVVGLGKLGLCLATVLASRGFKVRGVEIDAKKVDLINRGIPPIFEPHLGELLRKNLNNLQASTGYGQSIKGSDVTFVVVPTPTDESGEFSLDFVKPAMERAGESISKKRSYHLVVLTSTVMPGSTQRQILPLLERSSGKRCGRDFGLCYNPEFIALGDVINGLLNPDFVLIGESDPKAGAVLSDIQSRVCLNSPPIERMNFVNAEISKIAVNSFVTTKMTFANTIAEICEQLPGADVDRVTTAIGKDKRIGLAYLKGALGYGGPCFPRDNVAFAQFADKVGAQADLARATHRVNLRQVDRIIKLVSQNGIKGKNVAILGLSYKPNTNVIDESQSIMLAHGLAKAGWDIHVYDPVSNHEAAIALGTSVTFHGSIEDCVASAETCIIATPWSAFGELDPTMFKGKVVIDCWRLLQGRIGKGVDYIPLGIGKLTSRRRAFELSPSTTRIPQRSLHAGEASQ